MRSSAVYACVRILAETLAQVPLIIYRRRADGGRERAESHPLWDVLHNLPNPAQTSFNFREMLQGHLALRGNAYAFIVPGVRGFADSLVPIHPDRVSPERLPTGRLRYRVRGDDGVARPFAQDEVFHVAGLGFDGLRGQSPIEWVRESVGLALAAEAYGARFFGNDARPGGVLTHPGKLGPEGRANLKGSWEEAHRGVANAHRVAILEEGLKWEAIGMTSRDAQFLELRKFQVGDVARVFRVQPHKIGDLDKATFSNIEQQSIEFVQDTMMPWFVRWEQAINTQLILARQAFFAEFLVTGLLRGDQAARAAYYNSMVQMGAMTVNEVRRLENMNPMDGGDVLRTPLNMAPAAPAAAVSADPPAQAAEDVRRLWLGDAACRAARAEARELSALWSRAGGDAEKFRAALDAWAPRHQGFVERTVEAPVAAWPGRAGAARAAAADYVDEMVRALRGAQDLGALLGEGWERPRGRRLAELCDPDHGGR